MKKVFLASIYAAVCCFGLNAETIKQNLEQNLEQQSPSSPDLNDLKSRKIQQEKNLQDTKNNLQRHQDRLRSNTDYLNLNNNELKEVNSVLARIERTNEKLKNDLQNLQNEHSSVDFDGQISSLREQLQTAQTQKTQAENKLKQSPLQKDKIEAVNQENSIMKELKKLEGELRLNPDNQEIQNQIAKKQEEKRKAHENVSSIDLQLAILSENLRNANVEYNSISENLENLQNQKRKLENEINTINERIKSNENEKNLKNNEKTELENNINEAQTTRESIENDIATTSNNIEKIKQKINELNALIIENQPKSKENLVKFKQKFQNNEIDSQKIEELIILSQDLNKPEIKERAQKIADEIATQVILQKQGQVEQNAALSVNIALNNMNKRLGEVRGSSAKIGAWSRFWGGKMKSSVESFNYYSGQIGFDKMNDFNAGKWLSGGFLGFDKVNAKTHQKSYNAGVYASVLMDNGLFFDSVFKYHNNNFSQNGYGFDKQHMFLASFEAGFRYYFDGFKDSGKLDRQNGFFDDGFYAEPSLELITGRVGKYSQTNLKTDENINIKAYTPMVFKPQIFFGLSNQNLLFRAGVGGVFDTKKHTANIKIHNLVDGIDANSSMDLKRQNSGFVSVGGAVAFDKTRFNLSVERSFGGTLKNDYEINFTARYGF